MKSATISLVALTLIAVAGCASAPKRLEELERARAEVNTLAQDPLAAQAASEQLEKARKALDEADNALEKRRSTDEVVHLAYVAERQAEIGQALIAERRAREQIENAAAARSEAQLEAREREITAAKTEAAAARTEAEQAKSDLALLEREMTELAAKPTDRGMVVTLGDVLFDTAQATLKPGAALTLDKVASFLNSHPDMRIIIEGHTDSQGSDAYNQDLSERRAQAVASALLARGVPAERIQPLGRGEAFPVATNDTTAGRQQNRRVEIVFSDVGGRFASEPPVG